MLRSKHSYNLLLIGVLLLLIMLFSALTPFFFTAEHFLIGDIARCRNSQTAVPNHDLGELIIGHLSRKGLGSQIGIDIFLYITASPFGVFSIRIDRLDEIRESGLYLRVYRSAGSIDTAIEVEVMVLTV